MATGVTLNGVSYSIPAVGDSGWGTSLSAFLVALPTGVLTKAGGSFALTATADFGASFGLAAASFSGRSTPATAGLFRLGNTELVSWRNAANSANLSLSVNASNILEFNGAPITTLALGAADTVLKMNSAGTAYEYGKIANANVDASAGIAYSKLALTGSIVNADVSGSAAIAYSKLALTGSVVNADIATAAAIARSKLANGTASHVVINDGSGVLSSEATLSKVRGGTGADNSSVTFPSSGTIPTTSSTDTLSNKTLAVPYITTGSDFEDLGSAPGNPDASKVRLYFESGALRYRDSAGTVTSIGAGIASLNSQTGNTQTFAVGTSGTDFAISSSSDVHTFNLPDAGASARGLVSTGTQTIAGAKTFLSGTVIQNGGNTLQLGADLSASTLTDATRKYAYVTVPAYTNAEENVLLAQMETDTAFNVIRYGGGDGSYNAATEHRFFTAADATTLTGTERMRITSAGNVGIGTNSPSSLLEISAASSTQAGGAVYLSITDTDSVASILRFSSGTALNNGQIRYIHSSNSMEFRVNDTNRMAISSAGNVGIGTSSPGTKLHLFDGSANTELRIQSGSDVWGLVTTTSNVFEIREDANVRMSISAGGAVTVGPSSGLTARHNIQNDSNSDVALLLRNGGNSTPNGLLIDFSGASPDNNSQYFLRCEDSTAIRMRIFSDGDVNTADAGTLTSDERLKTNITDTTPKLEDLLKLQVRNFEWKEEFHPDKVGEKKLGFIAQEFETVFPGLIDELDFSTDEENPMIRKVIRQGVLIPMLVKALQELNAKVEALEAQL